MDLNTITDELSREIVEAAQEVHQYWGPGLYKDVYVRMLNQELKLRGMTFERQKRIPLVYKGRMIGEGLRIDLIVDQQVVVEIKAMPELTDWHASQLRTYMKLTGCPTGLLINFNERDLSKGIYHETS